MLHAGQIHFPARRRAAAGGDFGGGGGDEGGGDFALGFAVRTLPHGYAHVPVDHVGAPLRRPAGTERGSGPLCVTYRAESLPVRSALLSVAAKDVPTTAQLRVMQAAGVHTMRNLASAAAAGVRSLLRGRRGDERGEWTPLRPGVRTARLALAWAFGGGAMLFCIVVLLLVIFSKEHTEHPAGDRAALVGGGGDGGAAAEAALGSWEWAWSGWRRRAWEAYACAVVNTLLLQDSVKVAVITLVSPHLFPALLKKGGHKGARTSVTRRVCRFAFAVVDGIFS